MSFIQRPGFFPCACVDGARERFREPLYNSKENRVLLIRGARDLRILDSEKRTSFCLPAVGMMPRCQVCNGSRQMRLRGPSYFPFLLQETEPSRPHTLLVERKRVGLRCPLPATTRNCRWRDGRSVRPLAKKGVISTLFRWLFPEFNF